MSPQNQYEALLEELGPVAPQATEENPYAAVLQEQMTREEATFRTAQQAARQTTPDRAAEALRLSNWSGLPTDVVERNFDDIQRRAGTSPESYARLMRESPALTTWLANPEHAAVAHDDTAALSATERVLRVGRSVGRGVESVKGMAYAFEEATGELVGAEALTAAGGAGRQRQEARVAQYGPRIEVLALQGPWDLGQYVSELVGEQIPIMGTMLAGGLAGGAVGSVVPGVGTALGALIGAFAPALVFGVGDVQQTIKALEPTGAAEYRAPGAAFIGGTAVAAFDTVVPGRIGSRLVATFGRESAEAIARRALTAAVKPRFLRLVAGETIRDMASEGLTEALQEAIGAEAAALGTDTAVDWPTLGRQMIEAGAAGVIVGGVVSGPSAVLEFRHERAAVAAAQQRADVFTALGGALKDSKTLARLPEAAQAFIAHATKDGPLETVYVDTETFTTYWQSKGVDPALVAQELLGNTEAYPEAVRTGEQLAIPTAAYAVKIAPTAHNGFFAQELRFAPGEMNAREATAYGEVLEQTIAEATAAAAAAPTTEPTAAQAADPIYATVQTQLVQAGQPRTQAHANATVVAAAYQALGQRAGVDPVALFTRRGWIIGPPATLDEATLRTREAARPSRDAGVSSQETADGTDLSAAPDAGVELSDVTEEQPGADAGGLVEGRGDGDGVERGGVSAAVPLSPGGAVPASAAGAAEPVVTDRAGALEPSAAGAVAAAEADDIFVRQSAADTAARLTPEVHREVVRILDEMETFPFVARTWVWLEGPKTGNAAGGAANIVAGSAGANVYDDILYLAPVNRVTSGARKGQPARQAHGTRGDVIAAIRTLLETGEVASNLAEGALRVAQRRAAGDWKELSKPDLPPTWGLVAPVALTDALADAIDDALAAGEAEGDITFDVGELELQPLAAAGAADVLETGELQPRLPGAEAVRETEQATPEFDAPFALTPEAAPVPGRQDPFTYEQGPAVAPVPAPTFYSRLTRAVQASSLAKASGAQWKATISHAKTGISRDEFAYARVEDLADATVYTKADVLAYLSANTLTLEDVTLGTQTGPTEEQIRARAEALYHEAVLAQIEGLEGLEEQEPYVPTLDSGVTFNEEEGMWEAAVEGEDLGEWYETQAEAQDAVDIRVREMGERLAEQHQEEISNLARDRVDYDEAYDDARRELEGDRAEAGARVQYAEYVEPGAEPGSYREVFLTVPQIRSETTVPQLTGLTDEELYELKLDGWTVALDQIAQSLADGRTNEALDHVDSIVANQTVGRTQLLFQKLQQNLIWEKVATPVTWEDGHDAYNDIVNPVVRLRFNERTTEGLPIERRRVIEPYTPTAREMVQQNYQSNDTRYRIQVEGLATPHPLSFATLAEAEAFVAAKPTYAQPTTQRTLFLEEVQPPHEDQPMPPLLRKHWREIGFKWALRHASEQGFDVLAWTTGQMQVNRYPSIEKEVEKIAWGPRAAPVREVRTETGVQRIYNDAQRTQVSLILKRAGNKVITFAVDAQGTILRDGASAEAERWAGAPLHRVIPKELAAKILGAESGELTGEGLRTESGLRRLYDEDFPTVVKKLPAVKAAGGRVTTVPLRSANLNELYELTETNMGVWRLVERATNLFVPEAPTFRRGADAEQWLRAHGKLDVEVPALVLTPAMKAAALGGQPLFQPAPEAPRAAVTFTPATINIQLFAGADASSFMHEGAHAFFEVFGDLADDLRSREPATLTAHQQRLLTDYDAALRWLGIAHRGQVGVAQHEQFARGFEAYLREGTAPSKELRSVFAQFRSWLLTVYQSLLQLDVVLTPEVRAIFDRMLASDEAIAVAEAEPQVLPLFTTPESAGLTVEAFVQYRELVQAASDQAKAELSARLYRDWERERTATWIAARERIRAAVTAEVQQEPVYRARAAMRTGTHPDGTPLVPGQAPTPIRVNLTPLLPAEAGAISLDAAAELFGFTSGDELAHALRTAPTQRRLIAAKTYARLRAEFGDVPLQRAVLREKAEEAVYGAGRQVVVQAELKALTAGLSRGVIPPAALLRQHARERIRATRVRDLRPGTFLVAAQRASQRAFDLKETDRGAAVQAKQQELVNLALYREAVQARDAAERIYAWVRAHDREAARRRLGKAGGSYLEQWDGLLERFEFKRVPQQRLDQRAAIAAWAAAQEADNLPVDLPALLLDESQRTNYQNLTVDELDAVREGLEHLTHLARLKDRLLTAQRQRDFTVAVDTITTSLRTHHPSQALPLEFLPKDVKARKVAEWFASHRKLANLVRAMDGYQDGGALWEYLLRPINAAATREAALNQEATVAIGRLLTQAYTGRDLAHLRDTRFIPAIKGSLSKEARLMVALNWGNDGNRQRLRDGRQWTDAQVRAILDTLDARDVRFVQDVWDYIDTYWPAIAAKQRRVMGVAPGKVEATPFVTQHGTSRGGYFPLVYDGRLSARAGSFIDVEQANLQTQAAYTKATTRRGHTEARAARVTEPIRLELSVLYGHVEQVIHDLSHHEMLIDAGRLLGDRRVQQAIYETHGDLVYRQLKNALVDIAYGARPASNAAEQAINYLRQGTTVAGLAWNVWTAVQQPLGMLNGMARVGPTWVLRGLTHMLRDAASMESTARWVHERSEMMRLRHTTQQREISELRNVLAHPGGWFDNALRRVTADTVRQQDLADSYFWLIGQAQRLADLPTWIGQYEKSMAAGETEARAVALAEQAVLDAQGGGQIKDLAQVQRGSAVFKLFTNFYSYGSLLYNQTADAYGQTNFRRAGSVGQFVGNLLLLYTFPAVASVLLASAFGRDDDEERWLAAIGREMVGQALNTMVLVRELGGLARVGGTRGYEGPAGTRAIGAAVDVVTQAQQGELDRGLLRAAEDAAGILFRLPLNQVQRSIDGFVALQAGQTRNPLALLTGPPRK